MQCTDEDMAKDRTEGLPEPMTFQADANSRRKKASNDLCSPKSFRWTAYLPTFQRRFI